MSTRRLRIQKDVELTDGMLFAQEDSSDFALDFETRDMFLKVMNCLRETGRHDAVKLIEMYLSGSSDEIPEAFGIPRGKAGYRARNTLFQRIRREVRRAKDLLNNPSSKNNQAA